MAAYTINLCNKIFDTFTMTLKEKLKHHTPLIIVVTLLICTTTFILIDPIGLEETYDILCDQHLVVGCTWYGNAFMLGMAGFAGVGGLFGWYKDDT